MKKSIFLLIFLFTLVLPIFSWQILYAEQYFELYHKQLYQYPSRINENIYYLECALKSEFVNPLNALATIDNKKEWELYRNLFKMKCNILILEEYRTMASKFDKRVAKFFNQPYKEIILKSLKVAHLNYEKALAYWPEIQKYAKKSDEFRFLYLEEIYSWQNEAYKINNNMIDYEKIIKSDLKRLEEVIAKIEAMEPDGETYSFYEF